MRWRLIDGFESYEVSDCGSVRRATDSPTGGHMRGKLLRISTPRNGYPVVKLQRAGKNTTCLLHRLVAKAFCQNDDPSTKIEVNHIDGHISNCHHSNLEWVSRSENCRHSYRVLKRDPMRGERCGKAKLTQELVLEIRDAYSKGDISQNALGQRFGVSAKQISVIVNRLQWFHI